MTNMIIMESLRLKIYKKMLKKIRVTTKCNIFYIGGQTDIYLYWKAEPVEAVAYVKGTFERQQ
jgi:hypothetical protein